MLVAASRKRYGLIPGRMHAHAKAQTSVMSSNHAQGVADWKLCASVVASSGLSLKMRSRSR